MAKLGKRLLFIYCSMFLICYYATPSWAETTLEATRNLLQKGLTIHEIDRELERLTLREEQIIVQIQRTEQQIDLQSQAVEQKREFAGKVLRSYYMGERESILVALFSMDSFYDIIVALDYLQIIFNHDQRLLQSYSESYERLKQMKQGLLATQEELQNIKQAFLAERDKLLRLQDELETELAFLPDEEAMQLREEIERLTAEWESKGIVLFRKYFAALADVMQQLPEILLMNEDHLQMKGSNFTFQISDEQFNRFIRSKNDLFGNLSFQFEDGKIIASGEEADTRITLQGYYELVDEPVNKIEFVLETLSYNDFELPESTGAALEEQVDLAIYPELFQPPIEATAVGMEDNKLIITLKPKGSWFESLFGRLFSSS